MSPYIQLSIYEGFLLYRDCLLTFIRTNMLVIYEVALGVQNLMETSLTGYELSFNSIVVLRFEETVGFLLFFDMLLGEFHDFFRNLHHLWVIEHRFINRRGYVAWTDEGLFSEA